MRKMIFVIVACVFIFSGCSNAELEEQNSALQTTIDEQSEKIGELNEKLENAETYVQMLSDENTKLKNENTELKDTVAELQSPPEVNLIGQWTGKTYENEFFQVTANLPEGWDYLGKEDLAELVGLSLDVVKDLSQAKIESVAEDTIIPLMFAYPEYESDTMNVNAFLSFTKLSVKYDLAEHIELIKPYYEQLFSSTGNVTISDSEDVNIGGADMIKLKLMIEVNDSDTVIYTDYHYFYYGDYLGSFSTTYTEDKIEYIQEFINNIKFN